MPTLQGSIGSHGVALGWDEAGLWPESRAKNNSACLSADTIAAAPPASLLSSSRAKARCLIPFVSVAVFWIKKCFNPRRATLSGFFDAMTAKESQKAFSLVTVRYSKALSHS